MRYYSIVITGADGAPIMVQQPTSAGNVLVPFGPLSSHSNGFNNPGALDVEFDLPVLAADGGTIGSFLRIWGIGLQAMGQSANFNQAQISMDVGMMPGLPLAPLNHGVVLRSTIQQAFGNWEGTAQSLEFQIFGGFGSQSAPANIQVNWAKGQELGLAIQNALMTAYGLPVTLAVRTGLMTTETLQTAYFTSLAALAEFAANVSVAAAGDPTYTGINILQTPTGFNVFDGTQPPNASAPVQLLFTDLIGQPTWLNLTTIQFKTTMRADIVPGMLVMLPRTSVITTAASNSAYRQGLIFQGAFIVNNLRHVGHYKQRSAGSWVTVFEASVAST